MSLDEIEIVLKVRRFRGRRTRMSCRPSFVRRSIVGDGREFQAGDDYTVAWGFLGLIGTTTPATAITPAISSSTAARGGVETRIERRHPGVECIKCAGIETGEI